MHPHCTPKCTLTCPRATCVRAHAWVPKCTTACMHTRVPNNVHQCVHHRCTDYCAHTHTQHNACSPSVRTRANANPRAIIHLHGTHACTTHARHARPTQHTRVHKATSPPRPSRWRTLPVCHTRVHAAPARLSVCPCVCRGGDGGGAAGGLGGESHLPSAACSALWAHTGMGIWGGGGGRVTLPLGEPSPRPLCHCHPASPPPAALLLRSPLLSPGATRSPSAPPSRTP